MTWSIACDAPVSEYFPYVKPGQRGGTAGPESQARMVFAPIVLFPWGLFCASPQNGPSLGVWHRS
jgi:hypothetical protein